jgi:CubicO group peptidase (beta-lactamase class C family)
MSAIVRALLALLFVFAATSVADAQSLRGQRMMKAFTSWAARNSVDGASLTIIENGIVTASTSYGSYSPDEPVPIASLSKAITAVCVVLLADDGRLSLSDTIGELLPNYFAANPPADANATNITVKQLLTHSSGLAYDPTQGNSFLQFQPFTEPSMTRQLQAALAVDLGSKTYFYNNANYNALGVIIETVTGKTYENYCRDTVLKSVGVTTARFNPALTARGPYGAWTISTVDYARFMAWLNPNHLRLPLSFRNWPKSKIGDGLYYSLGVELRDVGKGYNVFHSGAFSWGSPINLSYGSYEVQYYWDVGYMAAYTPRISDAALTDLSKSMGAAAK